MEGLVGVLGRFIRERKGVGRQFMQEQEPQQRCPNEKTDTRSNNDERLEVQI